MRSTEIMQVWPRTHELIGDLHRPRADRRNAALTEYRNSEKNYRVAEMPREARRVTRKIAALSGDARIADGWWTHILENCARWLLRQAEKRRVRARMKAA